VKESYTPTWRQSPAGAAVPGHRMKDFHRLEWFHWPAPEAQWLVSQARRNQRK